jgi:arylsulfatase A-like enzyme
MLQRLRDEGILDDAILVILSDHGEDLWDHSEIRSPGHGHSLYEELIRIPLVVRAPGIVPAGARIGTPVSLLDIAPTLLALAGLPPAPEHQGRSLADTWRTGREPEVTTVRAESVEYGPDRFSGRRGDLKVILTPTPEKAHHDIRLPVVPLEIFDLGADPRERANLAPLPPPDSAVADRPPAVPAAADLPPGDSPAAAAPLLETVRERVDLKLTSREGEESAAGEGHLVPEDLRRQLEALGYTD